MGHESVLVIGADARDQLSKFQRPDFADPGNRHFILIDRLEEMKSRYARQMAIKNEKLSFPDWIVEQPVQMLAEGEQPDFAGVHPAIRGRHWEGWYRINAAHEIVELVERTIPGAIWDYYEGTENCLKLKPGAVGAVDDSGYGDEQPAEGFAGIARKRDIDFVGMRDAAGQRAAELWDADSAEQAYRERPALTAMPAVDRSCSRMMWFSLPRAEYIRMARDSVLLAEMANVVKDGELMTMPKRYGNGASPLSLREEKARHDAWFLEFNKMLDGLSDDTLFTAARMHS